MTRPPIGATPSVLCAAGSWGPGNLRAVLETFGSGNAPTDEWFLKQFREATERGIPGRSRMTKAQLARALGR